MSTAKTLLPKIQGSPYFITNSGRAFSQILFKPGYPLQSAELITLQNIINEQIKRFGNHIFEDGSVVTSEVGLTYDLDPNCELFELAPGHSGEIFENDSIRFVNSNTGADISSHSAVGIRDAFEDSISGNQYPDYLAVKKDGFYNNPGASVTVDVYAKNVRIGSLGSNEKQEGRYCSIGSGIFYVDGYFTNIAPESYIYHVDETQLLNVEVGVELIWEIADISHPVHGQYLFDPAENAFNENSPGADRLILKLQLSHRPLGFENNSKSWKFIPLIKFENNALIYRVKYPTYSVLGETLANRTYEINGNFVVDDFKLEVEEDALLFGTHRITNKSVITPNEESHWTVEGVDTNYTNLTANNYLIFGTEDVFSEINYKRLVKIHTINNDTNMIVSDIHYDDFDDLNHLLDYHWNNRGTNTNIEVSLRDEDRLSYTVHEGLAYVQGWRFDKEYTSKLIDGKARETKTISQTVSPNRHYFLLDYDEADPFVPNMFVNTSNFIDFETLEKVDLHCTNNREFYRLTIKDYLFNSWTPQGKGDTLMIDDALFVCVNHMGDLYELITYTKNDPSGVPADTHVYSMSVNGASPYVDFELDKIEKIIETPYKTDAPSNYMQSVFIDNTVDKTINPTDELVQFTLNSGYFAGLSANDYILITDPADSTFEITGKIISAVSSVDTTIEVKTQLNKLTDAKTDYIITKPSEADFNEAQYNSTKVGTIRANSISANNPERFYFSHYDVPQEFLSLRVQGTDSSTKITVLDLRASFASSVYKNMILVYGSNRWVIEDYDGETQTFTLETLGNPLTAIPMGNEIQLYATYQDVHSIVKTNYPYGKSFKGNIKRNSNDYPIIQTPTGSQQKFARLINEGDGEVKSVTLNDHSYNVFLQEQYTLSSQTDTISINYTSSNIADTPLGANRTKVYAGEDILDISNSSLILYHQGERIPILSSAITSGNLTIQLVQPINPTTLIIHLEVPIVKPLLRTKNLQKEIEDKFDVSSTNWSTTDRQSEKDSFQLKHSDVYRIRSIEIAAGKSSTTATSTQFVDVTHYFDLDNGQRETFYDRGRIKLKQNLSMPVIATGSDPVYGFRVVYDYFKPSPGHFFTVNSYEDIHYREIPVFTDPTNRKFPLRNVIDFRPVKTPAGSVDDFEQETDFTSDFIDLSYEYYLNENKTISIDGSSPSEIDVRFKNTDEGSATEAEYSIKLYQLKIPAYTFDFDDIEYKKIDNRRYTMNDISKLQKRIENLEDIAQLNSLELQTIQTKLITNDGDPRYKNGMLVDMFAGFTVADVKEENFKASVDLHSMKMHPQFDSDNFPLYIPSISANFPRVHKKIATLPYTSVLITDADTTGTEASKLSAKADFFKNGKFTLHPFSDIWYSQTVSAKPLVNEDNQYKNWSELRSLAHGTQWGDWEQYIYGVETEEKEIPLQNATLSQKTGSMVNNKNNIEKIIGNHKINTTLNYFSRNIRVGYVFERVASRDTIYQIQIREQGNVKLPSMHAGMRLHFTHSGSISVDRFKTLYSGFEITSNVTGGTASGTIRHIVHITGSEYYLYVSNITSHIFEATKNINELNGSVSAVHSFSDFKCDDQNVLCADFELAEKEYPMNSIVDVRLCAVTATTTERVEGSAKFHISGLIEKMTSHCHSVRPVQKKLFTHQKDENKPYIDDRTYKTNSSALIPTFLHQPFVLKDSMFLSQIELNVESASAQKFVLTIQPIVNESLSPSLVIPFSETIVPVTAGQDGPLSIEFDVPIFLSSNKDYAIVLRSESDDVKFRTQAVSNGTIFYSDCFTVSASGVSSSQAGQKIQAKLYRANFEAGKKFEFKLRFRDQSTAVFADQSRLNISSLNLADTNCIYRWRARNHDATVADTHDTVIAANKTEIHEKRKVFSHTWYEVSVEMESSNPFFSPVIDLERASVTTIRHDLNDGSMDQNLITGSGVRTDSFTDDLRVIMKEKPHPTLTDYTARPECSFILDIHGNIRDFASDPNFLVYNSEVEFEMQKWTGTVFATDNSVTSSYSPTTDSYTIFGNQYKIEQFAMINEFHHERTGNPGYRYYSPIVTLADDFEAMELYIQMDAILQRSNEALIYYRVLESSKPLEDLRKAKFERMKLNTQTADKYSNNNRSRTLEFETTRASTRFKYFQVKVCFTSTNFVEIPIVENIRILALDN